MLEKKVGLHGSSKDGLLNGKTILQKRKPGNEVIDSNRSIHM